MNANELADDLKSDIFKNGHSITSYHIAKLDEAATMLLQQQEALDISEKLCGKALATLEEKDKTISQQQVDKNYALELVKCHEQTISQQQAEIEALKAQLAINEFEDLGEDK